MRPATSVQLQKAEPDSGAATDYEIRLLTDNSASSPVDIDH
jgi:hypothetical protein